MNEINCGSAFHERIVLKKNDGELLAYVPDMTCALVKPDEYYPMHLLTCSRCGKKTIDANYCAWCRARVVDE